MKKVVAIIIPVILVLFAFLNSSTSSETPKGLGVLLLENHPKLFGNVQQAKELWSSAESESVLFNDSYFDFSDKTILSVEFPYMSFSSEEEKDIITGFEIYLCNIENNSIKLDTALNIAKTYFPFDVAEKYYKFSYSKKYLSEEDSYYVVCYSLTEEGKKDYINEQHHYPGTMVFVFQVNSEGIVECIDIDNRTSKWMSFSESTKSWDYDFLKN